MGGGEGGGGEVGGAGGGEGGGGEGGGAGGGEGGGGLGGLAGGENSTWYSRHGDVTSAIFSISAVAIGWTQLEQQAWPIAAASLLSQSAVEWVSPQKTKLSVVPLSDAVAAHDAQLIGDRVYS